MSRGKDTFDNVCRVCKKKKLPSEFRKASRIKRGYAVICKECVRQYMRNRYLRVGKTSIGTKHESKRQAITQEDYLIMFEQQNGICAICNKPETCITKFGAIRPLSLDHCHKTGKIRKLLCMKCNAGLGCFNDDESLLLKALQYLKGFYNVSYS